MHCPGQPQKTEKIFMYSHPIHLYTLPYLSFIHIIDDAKALMMYFKYCTILMMWVLNV
jgi:hypothetical protein